jgi:hypothetical protein
MKPSEEPTMQPPDWEHDPIVDQVLDGNAVAGVLESHFGSDVTAAPGECGHCGTVSRMGAMRAYVGGPGTVLRCGACAGVVLRIVVRPDGLYLDASGIRWLRISHRA